MRKIRNILKKTANKLIFFFAALLIFNVTTTNAEVGIQTAGIEFVDRNNNIIEVNNDKIMLTIDTKIQNIIENELNSIPEIKEFSFAAIDSENGEILASLNSSEKYMPSSTLRSAVAAIIIEQKAANKNTKIDDSAVIADNVSIKCWNLVGHGEETFEDAFINTCGPAFIRLSDKVPVNDFILHMNNFGFNINYDDKENSKKLFYENILGQNIKFTSLDMSKFYAAVVNGGKLIKEHILMDQNDISYINIMSKDTAETVFDLLKQYSAKKNNSLIGLVGGSIDENEIINSNFAGILIYGLKNLSIAVNVSYDYGYSGNLTSPLNEAMNNISDKIMDLSEQMFVIKER